MDEKTYNTNLPNFLHRSQSQIDDERERQERMRRDFNLKGARQTPAEAAYARSFEIENSIRANLEQINPESQPEAYKQTLLQLAETKSEQGAFPEAADIAEQAGDLVAANEYRTKYAAVLLDDEVRCDCPAETVQVPARGLRGEPVTRTIEIPSEFIAGQVYSQKHRTIMPLVMCANCGLVNVRDHVDTTDYSLIETDRGSLPEVKK
jgi:hypothetical protein